MPTTQPIQKSLFDPAEPIRKFDGETYEASLDEVRLTGMLEKVFVIMQDGKWRSLRELSAATGVESTASLTARLRDLRKAKFGQHDVERKSLGGGVWMYRMEVRK